jgi:hypothetical protein
MNLPLISPALNAVKNWADLGGGSESHAGPGNHFTRQAKLSFDQKFPRISNPIRLNDQQKLDLMTRLGFASVGTTELELALSRTPADTEHTIVANFVNVVIRSWREEHPNDSDAAAARKLLEGSASLAAIDGKAEAARLAAEQAEREHQAFERSYHEFRSVPAKHEQLTGKIASLEAERQYLSTVNFEAKIKQILEAELNPKPGVVIHNSVASLLIQRDTRQLRIEVIEDLLGQCKSALEQLADDNKRLAKELDLPEHKLS